MSYKNYLLLLASVLASCVHSADTHDQPLSSFEASSLCQKTEVALVSCQMDEPQQRMLAICHAKDLPEVYYRLGTHDKVDQGVTFTVQNPLLRWIDSSAYTTYFGFKDSDQYYNIGVPQETHGAKVFMDIFDQQGQEVANLSCINNSFVDKTLASPAIIDLDDKEIYKHGVNFPYDYYTNE
ncbi:hypothetical protein [uncultured Psychrobacter sp.]|uniref:hypothetical protein n=1 Tax=uncultured Psychrobacter sp. TaxID=259303 RepID=UPI00345B1558